MIIMKGLLLAGGKGTRLRPFTYNHAKQLLPIANKPTIFYAIEDLKSAGITDIGLIVGHDKKRVRQIKNALGDGSKFGVKFTYLFQEKPLGTAQTILIAEKFLGDDPFVMHVGDNILQFGIREYATKFEKSNYDAGLLFAKSRKPEQLGTAIIKNGRIVGVEKKPKNPKSNLVSVGVLFFRRAIFGIVKTLKMSPRGELEMEDAMNILLSGNYNIMTCVLKGWWKDIGFPDELIEANKFVLKSKKVKISIGKGTSIDKKTKIGSPVAIGKGCKIGPKTSIGPYVSIGNGCKISNSSIRNSILFDNSTVDSLKISNSIVGYNARLTKNSKKGDFYNCNLIL